MYHKPVLLKESIEALNINPSGIYADLTYGGGGHSAEIFSRLKTGKLVAFDCDDDAQGNLIDDERFLFVNQNFRFLKNFLKYYKLFPVDGIIADLGVSSHQFDTAERGFSIRFEGPLDLRMDQS
jgi:16S rRNA (cytosine1402-N4)-methyltransferase